MLRLCVACACDFVVGMTGSQPLASPIQLTIFRSHGERERESEIECQCSPAVVYLQITLTICKIGTHVSFVQRQGCGFASAQGAFAMSQVRGDRASHGRTS